MGIIEVSGLRKAYEGRAVVDGVSFSVQEGEIFGVLGPNGAGKTTTVECVECIRVPDGGTVRVGGLDPVADHDRVLMDLRMPGGGGVAAITELGRRAPRCKVLVLTTYDTDSDTLPAIEAGATGYLLKDTPRDELFTAVRAAAEGRTVLSPAVASRLVSRVRSPGNEPLSAREREVLGLVAKGTSNREIAALLFISEAMVKTHLTHIYGKLDAKDRAAAVAVAYDRGILD
ncbi:LuxR C-terminal-related transcriptional regulator [Streptomyces nigrescens]|uniref:LuxR C-terminal-related transcriptional regulator n=1 Tax=Streptomyces nigrescens TaxID=1920 RepID=UPI00346EBE9F